MEKWHFYKLVEEEYEGVEDPFYIATDKNCRNDLSIIVGRWYSSDDLEEYHDMYENQMDFIIKNLEDKGYKVIQIYPEKVNI